MRRLEAILVGFDSTPSGRDALALGALLAETCGAELVAARVRGKGECEGEEGRLEVDLANALPDPPGPVRPVLLQSKSAWAALQDLAVSEPRIGAIALGSTHRGGFGRVLPGGTLEHLLGGAPCALAVAPRGYSGEPGPEAISTEDLRVLEVGFDGSPGATAALELAATVAGGAGATLRVIAVGRPPLPAGAEAPPAPTIPGADIQSRLHEAVAALDPRLRALPIYEHGDPAIRLLDRAEEGVDMLVVGSSSVGRLGTVVLGSTSRTLIENAPCPVLLAPRPPHENGSDR
ncbi:MAG TPA: universal stress protein [Solirubrobacterales bacterium]|nr:universal stress protein [Solirubrobacterales bacterium]